MGRKITAYRFTLDEYKAMVRERDDLLQLETLLMDRRNSSASMCKSACCTDLEEYEQLLKMLEGPGASWRGVDADAYSTSAWEICRELKQAMDDYETALKNTENRVRARIDELIRYIADCEDENLMTIGGNVVVQTGLALGIEVK